MKPEQGPSHRSPRSFAPLTHEHLQRLAALADADHKFFTRPDGSPEYRSRRLAVTLAQGAALHYLDGKNGVKDLDVWTFYAHLPGTRFPADKRETHADFGPSQLGRQRYDFDAVRNEAERARWRRWDLYTGRRVDLLVRALPVHLGVSFDDVVDALQEWLVAGSRHCGVKKPAAWHLARKAVVVIWPEAQQGRVAWPTPG